MTQNDKSCEEPAPTRHHHGFKLGISKKSGRLQWCPTCNCKWIFFVVSATLVPIVLLLLFLSHSSTASPDYSDSLQQQETSQKEVHCTYVRPIVPEIIELEERELLHDIRTSFVPPDLVVVPNNCKPFNLRNDDYEENNVDAIQDYDYEDTDSLVIPVRRRLRRNLNITDYDFDEASNSETAEDENEQEITWTTMTTNDEVENSDKPHSSTPTPQHSKNFWKNEENFENIRNAQAQIMAQYMDPTINPCEDFYQYACGNWEKNNPIPQDKAAFDTFEMLRENLDTVLRELLLEPTKTVVVEVHNNSLDTAKPIRATRSVSESALRKRIVKRKAVLNKLIVRHRNTQKRPRRDLTVLAHNPEDDAEIKAKHLFLSCINYDGLSKRGLQPLLSLLDTLGGWPVLNANWNEEQFDWLNLTAQLRLYNNDIFIVEWVGPDIKNSEENVIQFDQTSLGLPTRDYFLLPTNKVNLDAYRDYMVTVINLLGADKTLAEQATEEIIDFEIQLANITSSPEERSNVSILYKRTTLAQLHNDIPQIDWQRYLQIVLERPIQMSEVVVIFANDYMENLVKLVSKSNSKTIANYLLWRFVRHRVNNLDDRFLEAKQKFYYVLFGREKSPPRWKNCVNQVNSNLGMAVGAMFVRKYFDENSKKDTLTMTHELQQAFREILNATDWIDPQTKFLAELKVNAMSLKIGYPDFILTKEELNKKYKDLDIHPDRYFENTLNVLRHLTRTEQLKLGQLVNKTIWNTAPAVVNAYYSRNKNQIMFPAGILQPPFYHRYFPKSLNYGGIGVVIGHELTHGFDDKGRLFDREGNLHRWWSDFAIDSFHERAKCLIQQYGNYTVSEVGIAVDGENTQGENIADNGGIKQAFRAYKHWLSHQTNNQEVMEFERLPGLNETNTQLFFLNFAQVWCGAMRKEAQKNKLKTAVHSPGKFRVIGTLSNSEDFANEYKCPVGSVMNPKKKCVVW